jgi:hypothetical protein
MREASMRFLRPEIVATKGGTGVAIAGGVSRLVACGTGDAMRRLALSALALALGAACSGGAPSKSERESATAALQQEAAALKRDGEKMSPSLGVKATWTIMGVDVQDQPGNPNQPLTGAIRFRINSQTREPTGVVETNFERTFRYVYDAKLEKWLLKP